MKGIQREKDLDVGKSRWFEYFGCHVFVVRAWCLLVSNVRSNTLDCIWNRFKKKQYARIVEKGQETSDKLHYITQLDEIGNACGWV